MSDGNLRHQFSNRAKHRLRIAARFMRQKGNQFANGEFYEEVLTQIACMNEERQIRLRELVDWIEGYEITERAIHGEPPRSRARKTKTRLGNRGALRLGASGAGS